MLIYKIQNLINGKCYIGQTLQNLNTRVRQHLREDSHCHALKNALQKYGLENFSIEVIAKTKDLEELNSLEKYYIALYNSMSPNGYNLIFGEDRKIVSQETREKLKIASTGRKFSVQTRDKIRKALSGNTNASGRVMSETNKNKLLMANSKITETEVRKIRELIVNNKSNNEIVESLGVSINIVKDIRRGKTWKHVQ